MTMEAVQPAGKSWRIKMPSGELLGWYFSKSAALKGIAKIEREAKVYPILFAAPLTKPEEAA